MTFNKLRLTAGEAQKTETWHYSIFAICGFLFTARSGAMWVCVREWEGKWVMSISLAVYLERVVVEILKYNDQVPLVQSRRVHQGRRRRCSVFPVSILVTPANPTSVLLLQPADPWTMCRNNRRKRFGFMFNPR